MSEQLSPTPVDFIVGRRKNGRCIYSVEGKRALVQAARVPGVSVARLALTHGVNANLLRKWMHLYGTADTKVSLRPATLLPVIPLPAPNASSCAAPAESAIDILLGTATIRLRGQVDRSQLTAVLECLARRS